MKQDIVNYMIANKVNILFGAGAPKCNLSNPDDEFPLMSDLVKAVFNDKDINDSIVNIKNNRSSQKHIIIEQLNNQNNDVEGLLSSLENISLFIVDNKLKVELDKLVKLIKNKIITRINSSQINAPLENYRKIFNSIRNLNEIKNYNNVVNVFTTNYDMLCEQSLDELNIHYYNGFVGNYKKTFNPNFYKYKYVENIDLNKSKYYQKKDHFNLYKLHGSFSWRNTDDGELYEIQDYKNNITACQLIQPSSNKFINVALLPYYSTLLREFSNNIKQEKSILITIGYGYNDLHINSLIKEALMLDQFTLIAGVFDEKNVPFVEKQLGGMRHNIQFLTDKDSTISGISQLIDSRILEENNE